MEILCADTADFGLNELVEREYFISATSSVAGRVKKTAQKAAFSPLVEPMTHIGDGWRLFR
jgi:hypothetical protein